MNMPQPKRRFKIKIEDPVIFECSENDIVADIKTACEEGMGKLFYEGDYKYILFISALYDREEVLAWLHSFDDPGDRGGKA